MKFDKILCGIMALAFVLFSGCLIKLYSMNTYAEGETFEAHEAKFVTFYDDGDKLTVKTDAATVEEAIERAGILINSGDIVEPALVEEINAENFFINIYNITKCH